MADTTNTTRKAMLDLASIKAYLNSSNTINNKTEFEKRDNTINAVTEMLKGLLNEESILAVQSGMTGQGSAAIGISGIGAAGKGNNAYFPSYNVRTPLVGIEINGTPIYPNKNDLDNANSPTTARVNFQSLNLKFPLGGVEKSITGSLQLFTKDPKELLMPLDMWAKNGSSDQGAVNAAAFGTSGFPTVKLTFGWAFSDSKAPNTISKALSPVLTFIATNVVMSDPGPIGTTFTITLHEIGTIVLEHSTDDVILLSDYPQEQLRTLLEGLLHVRLFTLDDLLYFNQGYPTGANSGTASASGSGGGSGTSSNQVTQNNTMGSVSGTVLPSGINLAQLQDIPTTTNETNKGFISAVTGNASSESAFASSPSFQQMKTNFLENWSKGTFFSSIANYGSRNVQNRVPPANQITSVPSLQQDLMMSSHTTSDSGVSSGDTSQTNPPDTKVPKSGIQTFFATQPSVAVGINGRSFYTVAKELASQCNCRWYPHDNSETDIGDSESMARIRTIASDLNMIKNMSSDTTLLTQQQVESIAKTLNSKNTSSLTKAAATAQLMSELKKTAAKLATKCSLYWIPNIPKEWKTTGSDLNSTGLDPNGESVAYDEGAFFLLPDILSDYDIFLTDLPVQYGPGASTLPYLYGSAQNVFQKATHGGEPQMFGEVISMSVNHSTLVTALALAAKEDMAYAVQGQYMSQIEPAIGFQAETKPTSLFRPDKSTAQANAPKKLEAASKLQKTLGSTFKHSCGIGKNAKLLVLDSEKLQNGADRSLPGFDNPSKTVTGPAQTATYMIETRVAHFLRYPTVAKISILGDPNLIRLGPGCFELLSYYPVEHTDKTTGVKTITQEFNALTSGLYFVKFIEHTITMDNFITTLDGIKMVPPEYVPSSLTNKIISNLKSTSNLMAPFSSDNQKAQDTAANTAKISPYSVIALNLNDPNFTTGSFAHDLQNAFDTYKYKATTPVGQEDAMPFNEQINAKPLTTAELDALAIARANSGAP